MSAVLPRLFGAAVAGLGAALLADPHRVADAAGAPSADAWVVRVLGARQLVQGLVTLAAPRRGVLIGGAVVDATHGASMVALAAASSRFRHGAATSGAAAGLSAVLGGVLAGRA